MEENNRELIEKPLTLTIAEIKDLADFSGLTRHGVYIPDGLDDDSETEIIITACPKDGIKEDDGSRGHYPHIAYYAEYPEEGVYPLGQRIH